MDSMTIAVDVAKTVFEVAVSDDPGRVRERHRFSRERFRRYLGEQPPATVVMEACGSAHYWGRQAQICGHQVVLLPPHTVRPYVARNKTDRTDAKGLLEAARNDETRPVPVKSETQQAVAALHRLRASWLHTRNARLNTLRGLLREFGLPIPLGARHVVPTLSTILEDVDAGVPGVLRPVLAEAGEEIRELDARIRAVDLQLEAVAQRMPVVAQLRSIPGIGLLTATALCAAAGDVRRFPSARHFASYLGLTPREHSTGERRRLGGISKRGDVYLRMLLIHGARSVLCHAKRPPAPPDRLRTWALQVEQARGHNKAAVALANKLARIAWAVWKTGHTYTSAAAS